MENLWWLGLWLNLENEDVSSLQYGIRLQQNKKFKNASALSIRQKSMEPPWNAYKTPNCFSGYAPHQQYVPLNSSFLPPTPILVLSE